MAYTGWIEQPATDLSLHSFPYYRGGGSATATTAMAVPIVKQNMGVVNVEALKRACGIPSYEHAQCAYWRKD